MIQIGNAKISKTFCTLITLFCILSFIGCDGDSNDAKQSEEMSKGGASTAGNDEAAGEDQTSTDAMMGGQSTSTEGNSDGGESEPAPEPAPPAFCPNEIMEVQDARALTLPYPILLGADHRNDSARWTLEVHMNEVIRPGTYPLEGLTPDDCYLCVYLNFNCVQNSCAARLFANQGTVVVSEIGEGGDYLQGTILEADFKQIQAGNTLVEPSRKICLQEQEFDVTLPALLNDSVLDFQLQNCETGEMVSLYDQSANQNGVWFIATAGWCPSCREHLSNIHEDMTTLEQGKVKPMFVVMEDDNYQPATAEFCRAYGRRYAPDSSNFYVDPNLNESTRYINRYTKSDGSWGIPWNNLIEADTHTLLFSDNALAPQELTRILNEILNR